MRTRWWTIATAATLVLLLAGAAQAATLNVGPGQTYTTIQAAVTAAWPGDTIQVAAGVYDEQVYITKALTLQGAGDTTIIKPSAVSKLAQVITYVHTAPATNATFRSIVAVSAGGADVSLKSLKVDGASITNLTGYAAIYYTGVVYFDTGGLIDHVTVANVLKVTGCTYANGIHATTSVEVIGGLEVANCTVGNSGGNNIILDSTDPVASGSPNSIVGNVHHNTIVGRGSQTDWLQNGIQFAAYNEGAGKSGVSGTIDHNTISDLIWGKSDIWTSSGILTYGTPIGPIITNNTVSNSDVGISAGIANQSVSAANISSNTVSGVSTVAPGGKQYAGIQLVADGDNRVTVDSNVIGSGYNYAGINFEDYGTGNTTTATVSNNALTVGGTGDGILDSFTGSGSVIATLSGNTISNWANGIHFLSTAPVAGYTITRNSIAGNTFGLRNDNAGTVVAVNNWWGSASGPGPVGTGTGDKVSARVTYTPWYVDAAMTTLSNVVPTNVYVSSTYVDGSAGGHAFGYDAFTTIQAGINAVATGGTVNVAAGLYKESNILVNKSLTIQGTGTTRDDVIVAPAAEDGNVDSAFGTNAQNGFIIKAHDVTIKNLTINGRGNTALTAGKNNFRAGIVTLDASQTGGGAWNNLHVDNVVVKYAYRRGISVFPRSVYGTIIQNSTVEYVAYNHGMYLGGQSQVLNNTVKHCFQGIVQDPDATTTNTDLVKANGNTLTEIGNFPGVWGYPNGQPRAIQCNPTGPARAFEVKNNTIDDIGAEGLVGAVGIYTRLLNSASIIDNNTITLTSGASYATVGGSQSVGMLLGWSYANGFAVTNNHVDSSGYGMGIMVFGAGTAAGTPLVLEGNTITGTSSTHTAQGDGTGIYVANQYLFGADTGESYVIIRNSNTISGFVRGIDVEKVSGVTQPLTVAVNWNSIAGNTMGVNASTMSPTVVDATDNYWGDVSGPYHATLNPAGLGNPVSDNVLFDPWTGMSTECVVTEPDLGVGGSIESTCAQTSVEIETAGGTTDVTIAKYTDNPAGTPAFGAAERYIDVQLSNPSAVTELTIIFDDMAPGTMIYFYRPGTGWLLCSDQTYIGGSIEVKVRVDTVPTLLELTGGIFAEGSAPGDINGDGKKDVLDVRLCLQIATGFLQGTAQQRAAANVDGDGDVDLNDAEWLASYIIHIIEDLGAE